MWLSSCFSTICWEDNSFPIELSWHPVDNQLTISVRDYFGLSVLFHWSIWPSLCQHHTLLMMYCNQEVWSPPNLFFLKMVLVSLYFMYFHMNFRNNMLISTKRAAGILYVCLESTVTLIVISLLIDQHGISFHLFKHLIISLKNML